jgi:hypothetical protein
MGKVYSTFCDYVNLADVDGRFGLLPFLKQFKLKTDKATQYSTRQLPPHSRTPAARAGRFHMETLPAQVEQ